jgi:Leucine-rich repeat (LRR) protein
LNKYLLVTAALAALAIYTADMHSAAFSSEEKSVPSLQSMIVRNALRTGLLGRIPSSSLKSQDALTQFFYDKLAITDISGMLPEIARAYYLFAAKGKRNVMPKWLTEHFEGVSVQDLIDRDILPKPLTTNWGEVALSLTGINDLTGIQNVPDAGTITDLILDNNQITTIAPNTFANFNNLDFISLNNNKIRNIAPRALATPKKIEFLYLRNNNIPESERERIQTEVGPYTTIFW